MKQATETTEPTEAVVVADKTPRLPAVQSPPSALPVPLTAAQARVVEVSEALRPAYEKASTLELTDEELQALMAPFPDSVVEIRPHDGLAFISHIHISNRLNRIFGPAKWALICRREWVEGNTAYGQYVLMIRGCYVGESFGGHPYIPNNPKTNWADAMESTQAEALKRIAGKRLSCGSQVWDKSYTDAWVAKYAACKGGKWYKKTADEPKEPEGRTSHVQPHAEAKPATTKPTVPTAATRTWFLSRLPNPDLARSFFEQVGALLPSEALTDLPLNYVPASQIELTQVLTAIAEFEGNGTGIMPWPLHNDAVIAPSKPEPQKEPEGDRMTGFVKMVTEKKTSKGNPRYGILIVQDINDREGGEWLNTFDGTDGELAKSLKGKAVTCIYTT